MQYTYFASCPLYFEDLLEKEALDLGATNCHRVKSGLYFDGDASLLYRACLSFRVASSVRLVIKKFIASDREELYTECTKIPWLDHLTAENYFACHATTSKRAFAPENFLALVLKDAIADTFSKVGKRPSVDSFDPDIMVALYAEGNEFMISLELGRSLFKRGYRLAPSVNATAGTLIKKIHHEAPLKENLAAALVLRAGFLNYLEQGYSFADPMCGSGTIIIEALMMALNIAPNLQKDNFGFEKWLYFKQDLFDAEKEKLLSQKIKTLPYGVKFYAGDIDKNVLTLINNSLHFLGLTNYVTISTGDVCDFKLEENKVLIISNPPYGERLLTKESAEDLYRKMAINFKNNFKNSEVALLVPNEAILKHLDVRCHRVNSFFNGADKRFFARFSIESEAHEAKDLGESATQLKFRLEKRFSLLSDIAEREWITDSYRLYDADLPEYNAAIDIYGQYMVVQEYQAPKELPLQVAKTRLKELVFVAQMVTGIAKVHTFIKQRRKIGPDTQYSKEENEGTLYTLSENGLKYNVNLNEYVDVGFYLDHRPLRRKLREKASGKDVLNLFCYTASMSVAVASGGANVVCSVDASNTYLEIAKENMDQNGFSGDNFTFIKSDIIEYLERARHKWDIIYLDPPTFSNSKSRNSFDIQRDHAYLIDRCMDLLKEGGELYFSTHYKRFKLDEDLNNDYSIRNITKSSLDEDFKRYEIHYLWRIRERKNARPNFDSKNDKYDNYDNND